MNYYNLVNPVSNAECMVHVKVFMAKYTVKGKIRGKAPSFIKPDFSCHKDLEKTRLDYCTESNTTVDFIIY